MIRRRRPQREIAFSFDSFLDVVANVVGIILRLILVAWVGARSYKSFVPPPPEPAVVAEETAEKLPAPTDPLATELPHRQTEIEKIGGKLDEQLLSANEVGQQTSVMAKEQAAVTAREKQLDAERLAQAKNDPVLGEAKRAAAATLAEMEERLRKVRASLEVLAKQPSAKQTLRYRTPVSKPLQIDELVFECRAGRITLIDMGTLLDDAQRHLGEMHELLNNQWEVTDETRSVGAFRLRYVVERVRSAVEEMTPGPPPSGRGYFSYGITAWQVLPVDPTRGESAEQALAPGSAFRKVIDAIEPNTTAVTFWVYPDSFATYRKVRDALHDRDVVVAGRPLPEGYLIAAGKHGIVSRGQ